MKKHLNKNSKKKSKGFTLIEMVISVGLFSMVMTTALAIILSFINDNKKSQAINSVVTNLNFSLDSMTRDIKTGYWYNACSNLSFPLTAEPENNCTEFDTGSIGLISTLDSSNEGGEKQVRYYYEIDDSTQNGTIRKSVCPRNGGTCISDSALTSARDVDITALDFYVDPGDPGTIQPSVFMVIKGRAAMKDSSGNDFTKGAADFTVQTMVTQRLLNIN